MPYDDAQRENLLSRLLTQYEQELAGEAPATPLDESMVEGDTELASEWHGVKHCLELLDRVRKHWSPEDPGDTLDGLRSALATPRAGAPKFVGRFELLYELGRGGLGVVYLARDPKLGRQIALKIPRIEVLASDEIRERFLRESEAAARLAHPNVVAVHEAGEDGLICYLATEYCAGPSLAEWLKARTEPVPFEVAARIVMQLASAVQHAHSRGVLHRDIKPSNVLLINPADEASGRRPSARSDASEPILVGSRSSDGYPLELVPKLADFGMAKLLERTGDETRSGAMIGTPAYMAPEQAQGRVRDVDARSDVYGLGTVLYELLTGRRPFEGETEVEVLRRVSFEEAAAPSRIRPHIPRDLEAIALRCLAKRPELRYVTAKELADDLQRFLSGRPTEARPLGVAGKVAKWARRRPAIAALVAVVLFSTAALFGVVVQYNTRLQAEVLRADRLRTEAQHEADVSRQLLYASEIRQAHEAYAAGNLPQMQEILEQQIPAPNQKDIRNFAWYHLRGLGDTQVLTLRGHTDDVFSVAYSPDGRRLATASKDATVRIWDAASGLPLHLLRGHTTEVTSVAWSPEGTLLASGSEDHTVRLWNPDSGDELAVLESHTDHVLAIAFSPDGAVLASGGRDLEVRLWDVATRTLRDKIAPRKKTISALAYSPDGSLLLVADEAGFISCFGTDEADTELKGGGASQPAQFLALGFSHASNTVAGAGRFGDILLWDWDSRTGMGRRRRFSHNSFDKVQCLAFSPSEDTLAFADKGGITTLWSFKDHQAAEPLTLRRIVGHVGRIWGVSWSPDGRYLATASGDQTVKVWDTFYDDGHPPLSVAEKELLTGEISPDGRTMFVGTQHDVHVVDLESRSVILHRRISDAHSEIVSMRCAPDGKTLAIAIRPDVVRLVDAAILDVVATLHWPGTHANHLAWSPNGKLLLVGGGEGKARIIDASTHRTLKELAFTHDVADVAFSPNGEQFSLIAGVTRLYDTQTYRELSTFDEADCIAFSPVDPVLATTRLGVISYWDTRTYEKVRAFKPVSHIHSVLRFSRGGRVLVTSDGASNIGLWDARSGQELMTLVDPEQTGTSVKDLVFATDDSQLFGIGSGLRPTGQRQARIWEWNAYTGERPRTSPSRHEFSSTVSLPPSSSTVYFTAEHDRYGREVWTSDGTPSGTSLLKDINPGTAGSAAHSFTEIDGITYFVADDGIAGSELWRSDGTARGTWLVKDIYPGERGSNPRELVNVAGTLYFRAQDPTAGIELWRSDGTDEGTRLVKDIHPGEQGSVPSELVDFRGTLYFRAFDGVHGRELWRSDGTEAGTMLVADVYPGDGDSDAAELTVVDDTLYFVARHEHYGYELFATDGTEAGTRLVQDIYPGIDSSSPRQLTNFGGVLFFSAHDAQHGRELWMTDGTPEGTRLVKDISAGGGSSDPSELTVVGNSLYFRAHDRTHGHELWVSRGTSASTKLITDIYPGKRDSDACWLTPFGNSLLFLAAAPDNRSGIWRTDGTRAGTTLVSAINPSVPDINAAELKCAGGRLFLTADDGVHGPELWTSDGTPAGTHLVKDIVPGQPGAHPLLVKQAPDAPEFRPAERTFRRALSHPDATELGYCVATDGKVVVVGAQLDSQEDIHSGRAYAYDAVTGELLHTFINPTPAKSDKFGNAVAVSGSRIVVGAYCDNLGGDSAGVAYIYSTEDGKLLHRLRNPKPAEGDRFGGAVSISGEQVVVGAFSDDTAVVNAGVAYVFDAQTGALKWTLFSPRPVANAHFGCAVASSSKYIVVGAHTADDVAYHAGAAYVFDAATGELLHELYHPDPAPHDHFGYAVAVSGDWIAVGAESADLGAEDAGAVYVFSALTGELHCTLKNPNPEVNGRFGCSLSLAGDRLVAGGQLSPGRGAAHLFRVSDGALLSTTARKCQPHELVGQSVAICEDFFIFGVWGGQEVFLYAYE